jgi:glutathione S-transferase
MVYTLDIPSQYGWVVLGAGVAPWWCSTFMSASVMNARNKYDVQYPNLYAVPGYHKQCDEFNRVQRGHQNFLENLGPYVTMTLLGGLKYPLACALGCEYDMRIAAQHLTQLAR